MKRVNVTLPEYTIAQLDEGAKQFGVSRSEYIRMLASNSLPTLTPTVPLERYLEGLKGVDLNKIMIAGEDLINHRMRISLIDLPGWIKQDAKVELTDEDKTLLKKFVSKL